VRAAADRLVTRVAIATILLSGLVLALPAADSGASIPNDQVTIGVSGSVTSMSSSPAFFPAFAASTHDYAIYCKSGVNVVSFTFGGVTPSTATVSLGENQAATVEATDGQSYWIRCLPHDFPVLDITGSASADPGYYLTGNLTGATNGSSSTYAMVLDSNGTPVWYQKAPGGAVNVEALPNDTIAWIQPVQPGHPDHRDAEGCSRTD